MLWGLKARIGKRSSDTAVLGELDMNDAADQPGAIDQVADMTVGTSELYRQRVTKQQQP